MMTEEEARVEFLRDLDLKRRLQRAIDDAEAAMRKGVVPLHVGEDDNISYKVEHTYCSVEEVFKLLCWVRDGE